MKTTIDIPEDVYRRVKAKSAIEGCHVRDIAITLFSAWVNQPDTPPKHAHEKQRKVHAPDAPVWFASLHRYAHNARGRYDMDSIRRSIARGRAREERLS